jgi:DNA replication protein DnaC
MLGELTMEVTEEWERVCRIPYKFYDTTFEDWDQIRFPAAFKNIKSQCESLLTDSPDLGSRLLMGTVGTGKTRLICTSAEYIMAKSEKARVDQNLYVRKNKCPVFYISEVEMFKFLYASIRNNKRYDEDEERTQRYIDDPDDFEYGDVESKLISRMGNIDFLLIDDIGKVKPRDLSYVQRIYYTVIDHRYTEEGKPVFLSTNLGKDALIEYLGKATYSRLVEMCGKGNIIVMAGDDYREILASKSEVKKVK